MVGELFEGHGNTIKKEGGGKRFVTIQSPQRHHMLQGHRPLGHMGNEGEI